MDNAERNRLGSIQQRWRNSAKWRLIIWQCDVGQSQGPAHHCTQPCPRPSRHFYFFRGLPRSLAPFGSPQEKELCILYVKSTNFAFIQDFSPRQYYPLHSRPPFPPCLCVFFLVPVSFPRPAFCFDPARAARPPLTNPPEERQFATIGNTPNPKQSGKKNPLFLPSL